MIFIVQHFVRFRTYMQNSKRKKKKQTTEIPLQYNILCSIRVPFQTCNKRDSKFKRSPSS